MQLELLISPPEVDSTPASRNIEEAADHIGTLACALVKMRRARTPDEHASAVDAALNAATPSIHRVARLYAASWPSEDVDVEELVQEALLEVAAALHFAPRATGHILAAWLSTLAFHALHDLWNVAGGDESRRRSTTTSLKDQRVRELPDAVVQGCHPSKEHPGKSSRAA